MLGVGAAVHPQAAEGLREVDQLALRAALRNHDRRGPERLLHERAIVEIERDVQLARAILERYGFTLPR